MAVMVTQWKTVRDWAFGRPRHSGQDAVLLPWPQEVTVVATEASSTAVASSLTGYCRSQTHRDTLIPTAFGGGGEKQLPRHEADFQSSGESRCHCAAKAGLMTLRACVSHQATEEAKASQVLPSHASRIPRKQFPAPSSSSVGKKALERR